MFEVSLFAAFQQPFLFRRTPRLENDTTVTPDRSEQCCDADSESDVNTNITLVYSSSSSVSSTATTTGTRRVRFAVDDDGKALPPPDNAVHELKNDCSASDRNANYYWRRSEIKKIQRHSKRIAAEYAKKRPEYVKSIDQLFGSKRNSSSTSDAGRDKQRDPSDDEQDDADAVRTLVESSARGLEHRATPLIHAHRRLAIENILSLQNCLKEINQSPENIQARLGKQSERVSRRSCYFAHQIALGDARLARLYCTATDETSH